MGCPMEAHSTAGEGSEFLVCLPVTAQAAAPERPAAPDLTTVSFFVISYS